MSSTSLTDTDPRAILAVINKLRGRVAELETAQHEPLAVVGVSCRFPGGASSPALFWRNLRNGVDASTEVPRERWNAEAFYDPNPDAVGKMTTRRGSFVDNVDGFDAQFFSISPREAEYLDPQHRLLLEASWLALENASIAPSSLLNTRTGVYVGIAGTNEYSGLSHGDSLDRLDAYSATGVGMMFSAGRLSYVLGLQGPSLAVDTACSSSLVALHLACQSLRARQCDLALTGGVSLMLSPMTFVALSRMRALAPDGRCKTFSAQADGYGRGEGCGMVVLKRLADALRDGDKVLAIIRGSAVNHDGASSGLTVPNGLSQQAVIRQALSDAALSPTDIDYVEAHGTGTALGDPIEVEALAAVYGPARPKDRPLQIGAVKTNIGHLESAAGIAGFIKVVLALQQCELPPHLHATTLSPHVRWSELPLSVTSRLTAWPRSERVRRAAVSAFGLSGTNAHVVVEEAPALTAAAIVPGAERPEHLLILSAKSAAALQEQARRYGEHLATHPDQAIADVCHTAAVGRSHLEHRLAMPVASAEAARERLGAFAAGKPVPGCVSAEVHPGAQPRVAFLFTGQGSQYAGMGRELYETQPAFRRALDQCAELAAPMLERPLLSLLFDGAEGALDQTANTQPALFAFEYALAELWRSWGIEPYAVLGHSVGELAAACVAGVLTLADGLKLTAARGRLMGSLPRDGEMASVRADAARIAKVMVAYPGEVSIAALNEPEHVVISGRRERVRELCRRFEAEGVKTTSLQVSHAFHSPLMEPMLDDFVRVAGEVTWHAPQKILISNLTGRPATDEVTTPNYWRRHAREAVRFFDGMQSLRELGVDTFVEVGPHPVLLGMAVASVGDEGCLWLASARRGQAAWGVLLESLARLHVRGADVDWQSFDRPYARRKVELPTYPFERQRHWVEAPVAAGKSGVAMGPRGTYALSGAALSLPGPSVHRVLRLGLAHQPYLVDHVVHGQVTLPGPFWVPVILSVAADAFGATSATIQDLHFLRPVLVSRDMDMHIVMTPKTDGALAFVVYAAREDDSDGDSEWHEYVEGTLRLAAAAPPVLPTMDELRRECPTESTVDYIFDQLRSVAIDLRPGWRWAREIAVGPGSMLCRIAPNPGAAVSEAALHPQLVDNCISAGGGAMVAELFGGDQTSGILPWAVEEVRWHGGTGVGPGWCRVRFRADKAAETFSFDVVLFDEAGRVLLEVDSFTGKRAPKHTFLALGQSELKPSFLELQWRPHEGLSAAAPSNQPRHFLVLTDTPSRVTPLLEGLGAQRCTWTLGALGSPASEIVQKATSNGPLAGIVCWWAGGNRVAGDDVALHAESNAVAGLEVVQTALRLTPKPRIWLVTQGAQAVHSGDPVSVEGAALWGLGRTVVQESPDLRCTLVDLASTPFEGEADALVRELLADDREEEVALRAQGRFVGRIVRRSGLGARRIDLRGDATYLVTGGLGGLGLTVAQWMVERGARHLVLLGRRGAVTSEQRDALAALERAGAHVRVARADIAFRADLQAVLGGIRAGSAPLRGVVHAAGVLDDSVLTNQNAARFATVMAPKVAGAWHLHELTREDPLDFFVLYSSAASLLGSAGQGNYAAANAFLDALAHHRRALDLPALSVSWGPFADVGMAAAQENRGARLAERGMRSLTPAEGTEVLGRLMSAGERQVGVVPMNVRKWVSSYPQATQSLRLSELVRESTPSHRVVATTTALVETLRAAAPAERRALLESYLREQVGQVLKIDVARVGVDVPFKTLGIDSLMGLDLLNRLDAGLGLKLPASLVWTYPSVGVLAEHLDGKLGGAVVAQPAFVVEQDAALDENLRCEGLTPAPVEPEGILLTGATGFVGAFLLDELLQKTHARIFCLVRTSAGQSPTERLKETLRNSRLLDIAWERVVPVASDLSQPLLGLAQDDFDALTRQIDQIFHCGAVVNWALPYSELKKTNVSATREIVRLACGAKRVPIHNISTLAASFGDVPRASKEDWSGVAAGYAQSKWVSERLLMTFRARGGEVSSYRLPYVLGHSVTGVHTKGQTDFVSNFLSGCVQVGSFPDLGDFRASVMPVDEVARTIVALAKDGKHLGRDFSLATRAPFADLVANVRAAGYPVETVPLDRWRADMPTRGERFDKGNLSRIWLMVPTSTAMFASWLSLIPPTPDGAEGAVGQAFELIQGQPINAEFLKTYLGYLLG